MLPTLKSVKPNFFYVWYDIATVIINIKWKKNQYKANQFFFYPHSINIQFASNNFYVEMIFVYICIQSIMIEIEVLNKHTLIINVQMLWYCTDNPFFTPCRVLSANSWFHPCVLESVWLQVPPTSSSHQR